MRIVASFILGCLLAQGAGWHRCGDCERDQRGHIKRSASSRNVFKKMTGFPKGRKGYIIDHVIPLACADSAEEQHALDQPQNMQWQSKEEAKQKDAWEEKMCPTWKETHRLFTPHELIEFQESIGIDAPIRLML